MPIYPRLIYQELVCSLGLVFDITGLNRRNIKMEEDKFKNKLFFSIGEVSQLTGIKQYILRYWESEFNLLSPEKTNTGQRRYRKKDIELILKIKDLLYKEGYTIAGAKRHLRRKELKEEGKLIEIDRDYLRKELMDMLKIIGDR